MDEIIDRFNRAVDLYSPVWEQRAKNYNDAVASAVLESWKDVKTLIEIIQEDRE